MNKLIAKIEKNSAQEIQINLAEFKGQAYIDIRLWEKGLPSEPGGESPTKKGICFHCELIDDIIDSLHKAKAALKSEGND